MAGSQSSGSGVDRGLFGGFGGREGAPFAEEEFAKALVEWGEGIGFGLKGGIFVGILVGLGVLFGFGGGGGAASPEVLGLLSLPLLLPADVRSRGLGNDLRFESEE